MLKNFVFSACLLILTALPLTATAGTAYVPFVLASSGTTVPTNTELNISNISNVTQHVVVTFFNVDGNPIANYSLVYASAAVSTTPGQTNANGEFIIDLPPMNAVQMILMPGSMKYGHAKITGTVTSGNSAGFLIASGAVKDNVWNYVYPLVINGGNPF